MCWEEERLQCPRTIHVLFAIVEQRKDMRMIEHSNGSCLALEKPRSFSDGLSIRIRSSFSTSHLNSNLPMELHIICEIDFAHIPATDQVQKSVATELLAFE